MQVDVRQQRRYHRALGHAPRGGCPAPVLNHPRLEPFAYQRDDAPVRYAVFQKLQHPVVVDFIKERLDVCIQYPVHVLALDSNRQSVQRIVLAAPLAKSIRESKEVRLMDVVQYGHHRLLNHFVLQCGYSQRPRAAIGFGYEHPS